MLPIHYINGTVDPRARAVIKDLMLRVERLETSVFKDEKDDPFA